MIRLTLRIRVNQRAKRTSVYHEPRDERAELGGREQIHFEHADRVWADGPVENLVDAEFGDCVGLVTGRGEDWENVTYILVVCAPRAVGRMWFGIRRCAGSRCGCRNRRGGRWLGERGIGRRMRWACWRVG
jgi:hypothetical protein